MRTLDQIDLYNKNVLIRVDFNVPLDNDKNITDDTRIKAALPTIEKVLSAGGKPILMSHLGRPKGQKDEAYSMRPVADYLDRLIGDKVTFIDHCIGYHVQNAIKAAASNSVVLLENLRFYIEETEGDKGFAEELAKNGDVYVNDAFGTAHRAHASTAIIAEFFDDNSKCFGYLMAGEINSLEKAIHSGKSPKTAVIGGSKVSSKIDVLARLLDATDNIIIGGGMAYTFTRAQGGHVGKSLVEEDKIDVAKAFLNEAAKKNVSVYLPEDSTNSSSFSDEPPSSTTKTSNIPPEEMGLDIGAEAIRAFSTVIEKSNTIIWNGPMGVFEFENYQKGTKSIGLAIAKATSNGAFSLVGGGDSVAAVKKFNLDDQVSYISTGGGAMLEYLEGKVLPGIKSITG